MSGRWSSPSYHRGPGERAAGLAASYCTRRLGRAYAQAAWQILADATRLGVIRHGRPEAWVAGAVVALLRANGLLGADRTLAAREVADELDVTLGTLAVTERELARALNLTRYARRLPARGRNQRRAESWFAGATAAGQADDHILRSSAGRSTSVEDSNAEELVSTSPERRRPDPDLSTACGDRGPHVSGDGATLLLRRRRGTVPGQCRCR